MGFEVPYQYEGVQRRYIPDFILKVDDGCGEEDLLNLVVEAGEAIPEVSKQNKKATTMATLLKLVSIIASDMVVTVC